MHRSAWRVAVCLLAVFSAGGFDTPLAGEARPIRFEHISLEQGLSQSTASCIFQDSRGFLWIGTEDGLNRFDGYDFQVYKHDSSDPTTLGHDAVWSIDEDENGDLWVGTAGGGVAVWERAHDRFARLGTGDGLSSPYVRVVHVGRDGIVWIGTRDTGLDRLDPSSEKITHYRADDGSGLSDDRVFVIYTDRSGDLWVGTDDGLNRFDARTGKFVMHAHDPVDPSSLGGRRVRAIFEDGQDALWVGTYDGGLSRLDPRSDNFTRFRHEEADPWSLSHDRVRAVLEDGAGRLWVGTSGGLDLLHPDGARFVHFRHDSADPHSLNDNHVMSLFQDRGGVLWIGTRTGGLNRWNPLSWQFGHQSTSPGSEGLSNSNVMAFWEDPAGRLWIGTFGGGIDVMDRTGGSIRHHRHDPDDARSLSSNRVTVFEQDRRGTLWVGTLDGGLNRFDAETETFVSYRHMENRPESIGADGITSILEDRQGRLWIGTFGGGLDRFDRESGVFVHYRHDSSSATSLSGDRVTSLLEDSRGSIWVGTDGGGLSRFDPETGSFSWFKHDPDDPGSLASDSVFALHMDVADTLWIGTRGGGLDRLGHAAHASGRPTFQNYSERNGLPNEVIYAVLPDDDGNLWLSTNNGLSRFDTRSETFVNYDANDGLQSNEFHFGSSYRSPQGELFFGGVNGFNSFFPDRLETNPHAPQMVLTSFLKFNQPVPDLGPSAGIEAIDLGYDDDVVTFEFAALDYSSPDDNRYVYMLEGFDKDWVDAGDVRRVTYTNLDPGQYVFRVRGTNNDGVWSETDLSVSLHVETPPWQTAWAYALYTLILGGVVLAFWQAQQRKLKREAAYSRRLEQEVDARTAELAQRNEELVQASITDSLTGLANRRYLLEYMAKEVSQIQRRYARLVDSEMHKDSFDLAFMMVDLDNFKTINDTCGHAAGDVVLRQMKTILEDACRNSDILIRWGGDELMVVARDTDQSGVEILAERIRSRIEGHRFELEDGQVVRTTSSIGFACYPFVHSPREVLSWEQAVSTADRALYVAKRSGRNAWVGFLGTDKAPCKNLMEDLLYNPRQLALDGLIEVRASIAGEIVWDCPEPHQLPVRVEPGIADAEAAAEASRPR